MTAEVLLVVHTGHALAGSSIADDAIPLCWYAEHPGEDEHWLTSLDHEVIREDGDSSPGSFVLARQGESVTCADCTEWVRS